MDARGSNYIDGPFCSLKIDFKDFSGEFEDRNAWSRAHTPGATWRAQVHRCTDSSGFNNIDFDPETLRQAHQTWV